MIRVIFKPGLLRLAENNLAGITIDLETVERIGKLINKFASANPQLIMPVHIVLWNDKIQFLNDRNFDGKIDKDTSKLAKVSKECEWYMEALFQRNANSRHRHIPNMLLGARRNCVFACILSCKDMWVAHRFLPNICNCNCPIYLICQRKLHTLYCF